MTGPTIATVSLRIAIDKCKTVKDLLHQVQLQATEMMPFEQVGIQQIRRISDGCKLGCEFQSHMVIQPTGKHASQDSLFESSSREDETDEIDPSKLYAICLEFTLERSSIHLRASYDSTVVSKSQFQRLAERFENVLRQVSSPAMQNEPLSRSTPAARAILSRSGAGIIMLWMMCLTRPSMRYFPRSLRHSLRLQRSAHGTVTLPTRKWMTCPPVLLTS
jgi:hypothetical protein